MAWRIVKQPNGLLARFSDIVDNFTHCNMDELEAYELCKEEMGTHDAKEKVFAGVQDFKPWMHRVVGSGHDRWDDCIKKIETRHGKDELDKVLKEIDDDFNQKHSAKDAPTNG